MAVVAAYETKAGKRYRVRYRTPEGKQTDKRRFTRKRDAEQFAATVEVAKMRGKYVRPSDARATLDGKVTSTRRAVNPGGYRLG
ncbi:hypothetical protein [Mycolicibacterium chubuense]|nr:hypothetical protein [Mycolicibacterium chubuense]